jgi:hypothetical protein
MIWLKFVAVQLVMLLATIVGWFLLIPFCYKRHWVVWKRKSIKDGRPIDEWVYDWVQAIYGNPEDGVSGRTALVWNKEGSAQTAYAPTRVVWLNAYLWSAWRNSADNLKYVFADPKGPLITFKLFSRTCKVGYQMENGYNVPVFSL